MKNKKILSLEDILDNPTRELEVKGLGTIKIKDPTVKDRMDASVEARKHPNWDNLDKNDQAIEIQKIVALKMLIEPKITLKEYYEANDINIIILLDAIALDYGKKIKELTDRRNLKVHDFLENKKGS